MKTIPESQGLLGPTVTQLIYNYHWVPDRVRKTQISRTLSTRCQWDCVC